MAKEKKVNTEELQQLIDTAKAAAKEFANFKAEKVAEIVDAVCTAGAEKAEYYAEWAVRETGFGVVEHKVIKNQASTIGLVEYHRGNDYCGYRIDREKKVVKIARSAGVVLSLIPSTNPVASTNFSILSCLMTRNAVIMCPHPASKECSVDAAEYLAGVAERAGVPKGVIQVVRNPSIPLLGELMKNEGVNLILATGGSEVVRAAYSSGNPALGVGAANVAHYVDGTNDLDKAAAEIVFSSHFDNNLMCTCDSVVLAERAIADQLVASMTANGTHFVAGAAADQLRNFLFPEGGINPEAIGKPALWIAEQIGIKVAPETVLLCVEIDKIGYMDEVMSREKMFPAIGFMRVDGVDQAYERAEAMLEICGKGHSAAIHSENTDRVALWSKLPVYRISVNGCAGFLSGGGGSGLAPTFTLGTGFFGRSSVGENVGPDHLIHWTAVAYNLEDGCDMAEVEASVKKMLG